MPRLDLGTLVTADIAITAVVGAMLLFAWFQNRAVQPLGCWGVAQLFAAAGLGLLAFAETSGHTGPYLAGVTLIILGHAMMWSGARLFDGRRFRPLLLVAGPVLWLVASLVLSRNELFALAALVNAGYSFGAGYEFWRGRDEPLISRWPAIGLLAVTGGGFLLWIPYLALLPYAAGSVFAQGWFPLVLLVALVGKVALAILVVAMAKERLELRQRVEALTDPLTGLPNRRAFFRAAARRLRPREAAAEPVSLLLFDLDRFKTVNDRYGHGVGDRLLKRFADTLAESLHASDVMGRIGGEEFATLLPATRLEDAAGAAERVRAAFEEAGKCVDGAELGATVSVGAATAADSDCSLHELLARADEALYAAKQRGRNRVELAADTVRPHAQRFEDAADKPGGEAPPAVPRIEFDLGRGRTPARSAAGT